MSESVIQCSELEKWYRTGFLLQRKQVLKGVDFEVRPGEIYGFLGPNGAGKTTTIKILLGLVKDSGGSYSLFGEPQSSVSVRSRIGFLPDNPYFYDELSGVHTMALAARMCGLDGKTTKARTDELLERVGLDKAAWKMPVRKYSRGMLQRLGLAQALVNDPELLICDEPMEGLDPIGRYEVRRLLMSLRDEGKTVFFSTHILSDIEVICDRIGVIVQGKIRRAGPLAEMLHPRVKSYDVAVKGIPAETTAKFREAAIWAREEGEVLHLSLAEKAMAEELARLVIEKQGELLSLTPVREDLDEYFYQLVREDDSHE